MQNEEPSIQNLQQHIAYLHQYTQQLNKYLADINVYEYYIQRITVESVKGTLQLGHLTDNEIKDDDDGVHRFYIGDLKINKIEDSGTVGLGVTEKGSSPKEEDQLVSLEEASPDIQKIYEGIKSLLAIEEVPSFFQAIASKEVVLKKIWDFMDSRWDSSFVFNTFYEELLKQLNEIGQFEEDTINHLQADEVLINVANNIEEKAKSLLVITKLLEVFLPGYLSNYNDANIMINPDKLRIKVPPNKKVSRNQIKIAIKNSFNLKELPETYDEIMEDLDFLEYVFYHRIQPVVHSGTAVSYFTNIQDLYQTVNISEKPELNFSSEEQVLLFSSLIKYLDSYQKHTLLEYLLL
jgi:hypothetical protein